MNESTQGDWAQSVTILGFIFGIVVTVSKWINESFKNRREERETVIKIAVREAMSDIRKDIEVLRKATEEAKKYISQASLTTAFVPRAKREQSIGN